MHTYIYTYNIIGIVLQYKKQYIKAIQAYETVNSQYNTLHKQLKLHEWEGKCVYYKLACIICVNNIVCIYSYGTV